MNTQREWEEIFDGTDACVTPVVALSTEDNRPIARLSQSPGLDVANLRAEILEPGNGASGVLNEWMGWTNGWDYCIDEQGTISTLSRSRL
jgi:alpha-methylacyl-CoA racemase